MRRLYVGQKPLTPMVLSVTDTQGQPVVLTAYATVAVLIKSPTGTMITDATAVVTRNGNKINYAWGNTSIFTAPGDYQVQAKLTAVGGVVDYTSTRVIEVFPSLEA